MSLPRLYKLSEVREATGYGRTKVWQVLKSHPEIRPIGRGRGTRLTEHDYLTLIEALRCSNLSHLASARGTSSGSRGRILGKDVEFSTRERDKGRAEIPCWEESSELLAESCRLRPDKGNIPSRRGSLPRGKLTGKRSGTPASDISSRAEAGIGYDDSRSGRLRRSTIPGSQGFITKPPRHHSPPRPSTIMRPSKSGAPGSASAGSKSRPQTRALRARRARPGPDSRFRGDRPASSSCSCSQGMCVTDAISITWNG